MDFIDVEVTEKNIKKAIKRLSESQKVTLWNDYQDGYNSNNHIYTCDMDTITTMFPNAEDVVNHLCNGNVNYSDNYISCNSYGKWESFNSIEYFIDSSDFDNVIDWIINCDGQTNVIDLDNLIEYEK